MYDNAKLDSMLNLKGYDEKAYFFMLDGDQNITYTNQSEGASQNLCKPPN